MPLIIVHLQLSNVQKGLQRLFNSDKALANPQVWDVDVDLLGCLDHETDSYTEDFDDAHFWWLWSASCTGNYWFVCTGIWHSKWNGDDNFFWKCGSDDESLKTYAPQRGEAVPVQTLLTPLLSGGKRLTEASFASWTFIRLWWCQHWDVTNASFKKENTFRDGGSTALYAA